MPPANRPLWSGNSASRSYSSICIKKTNPLLSSSCIQHGIPPTFDIPFALLSCSFVSSVPMGSFLRGKGCSLLSIFATEYAIAMPFSFIALCMWFRGLVSKGVNTEMVSSRSTEISLLLSLIKLAGRLIRCISGQPCESCGHAIFWGRHGLPPRKASSFFGGLRMLVFSK